MSDTDSEMENRIRERAFYLWHEAGCPEERAEEFWERARAAEQPEDAGDFA